MYQQQRSKEISIHISDQQEELQNPPYENRTRVGLNLVQQQQQSHEKSQVVTDALCGSRTFYIGFNAMTIGMMALYDNSLKDEVMTGQFAFPLFFLALICVSAYLFWTNGQNPGNAPYHDDESTELGQVVFGFGSIQSDSEEQPISNPKNNFINPNNNNNPSQLTQHQSKSSQKKKFLNDEDYDNTEESKDDTIFSQQSQSNPSQQDKYLSLAQAETIDTEDKDSKQSSFSNRGSINLRTANINGSSEEDDLDYLPQLFYCEKCKRNQPFRSKHCDNCGRCILKFDHHWQQQRTKIFRQFQVALTVIVSGSVAVSEN